MVKKVIPNLDFSKASGPDCIQVVVLKKCEPELSYILAELFKSVLRSLVFQIVGSFHQWSLYLRILGKGPKLKTVALLSLPSVVSKVFEKLVNDRIVDYLEKGHFLISGMVLDLFSQLQIF